MRFKSGVRLEPEVLVSIKHYRRRALALRAAGALPLLLGVLTALAVFLSGAARGEKVPGTAFLHSSAASWAPFLVIAAFFVLFVFIVGPEKIPVISPDNASFRVFQNALEGVGIAVGLEPPELLVLGLPTVNSISLVHARRPAVGVTKEALEAALPHRCAEAMMAHELSHGLMGDVFLGSNKRRWRLVGLSLAGALLLPFALLALSFGFGAWLYIALFSWTVLMMLLFRVLGRRLYRQNDLLSDSIAVKITGDPAGMKDAILLVEELFTRNEEPFAPGARYPELLFMYEARPEVELRAIMELNEELEGAPAQEQDGLDESMRRKIWKRGAFPRFTIAERIRNLEAIERGHWLEFER